MYLKDSGFHGDCSDAEARESRLSKIESAILAVINQPDATVQVGQWKVIKEEDDANEKVSNFDFVFRETESLNSAKFAFLSKNPKRLLDFP